MNNSSDEETFEKLNINPSSAKDLAADLFNDTKFEPLHSSYSSDKLINFSAEFSKDYFSIFHLNATNMNKNVENLKDLIVSQTNPCKVIVLTWTWLADKKVHNDSLFLILNFSLIPEIRKCSHKGVGVVIFIHKSLNYKITHDLRKEMILLKLY